MNVIRNLFCPYQAAPENDLPLEIISSISSVCSTNDQHDDRSNPFNEASILAACRGGNLAWVRELLESDPHLVNQTALSGKTGNKVYPLYIAVQAGVIDVVKHLIAVYNETLKTLPEADRDIAIRAIVTAPYIDAATPIFSAAQNGHINVVKYLIAVFIETLQTLPQSERNTAIRAMVTAPCTNGRVTPVYIAVRNGHLDVVKYLIAVFIETVQTLSEADRDTAIQAMVTATCNDGTNPLFIAAHEGHFYVVKYLIAVFIETLQTLPEVDRDTAIREMVMAPCKNRATPVFIASQNGHINVVRYLIAVFIETLQTLPEADRDTTIRAMITAPYTNTLVCIAVQQGHIDVLQHLIAVFIKTLQTLPEADRATLTQTMIMTPFTDDGATPIYIAAQSGHIDIVKYLIAVVIETLQALPEADRDTAILRGMVTAPCKNGATPVYIAAQKGHIDVLKHLIPVFMESLQTLPETDRASAIRAMIMAPFTDDGSTPVYIAAQEGHIDVVKYLIAVVTETLQTLPEPDRNTAIIRAMVTAPCSEGETPVFAAADNGHIHVAKHLIAVFIETLQTQPEADSDTAIRAMITAPCTDGTTPVYIAAQNGHINVVKHLIAVFIETLTTPPEETDRDTAIRTMVTAPCKDGATSVFIAAQNGHGEIVNWLLENGADPKNKWVKCFLGKYRVCKPFFTKTPLEAAIENKHIFIAARLNMAIRERKAGFVWK